MKRVALATLCCAVVVCLAAGPVSALPRFKKDFTDKYVEPTGDEAFKSTATAAGCNVCHVKGEGKDKRNPFGEELAKYIDGSAKDRVAAATANDTLEAETEKLSKELAEAFKKVEAAKSPSGATYGELLKAHKLPVPAE
jgi:hypothetical protein